MQIVLCEKIRWIRLFNISIKGNFKHINIQCARNINHTLLLKMTVVSEQMAMLWFYFITPWLKFCFPLFGGTVIIMNFVIMRG